MPEYNNSFFLATVVVVGFERCLYTVGEEDRQVEVCVNITVPRQQDIGTVTFNLTVETQNGSAGISYRRRQNVICFTLIGCGGMFIRTQIMMYNLSHSYMHYIKLHKCAL